MLNHFSFIQFDVCCARNMPGIKIRTKERKHVNLASFVRLWFPLIQSELNLTLELKLNPNWIVQNILRCCLSLPAKSAHKNPFKTGLINYSTVRWRFGSKCRSEKNMLIFSSRLYIFLYTIWEYHLFSSH